MAFLLYQKCQAVHFDLSGDFLHILLSWTKLMSDFVVCVEIQVVATKNSIQLGMTLERANRVIIQMDAGTV
jgi:hypothetical protein